MKKNNSLTTYLLIVVSLILSSCSKEEKEDNDVKDPSELELQPERRVTIGAQSSTKGSFYEAADGVTYLTNDVKNASTAVTIDFACFYGTTHKMAFFSPKALADNNYTYNSMLPASTWGSSPNTTKFIKGTLSDYDNASKTSIIAFASNASLDNANGGRTPVDGLKEGDVYGFKTSDGLYGVIKINNAGSASNSTVSFYLLVLK